MIVSAKYTALVVLASVMGACASTSAIVAQVPPTMPPAGQAGTRGDTLDPNWIPSGFGTLRQDDIALKVSPANGLQVRAIPLDERIIRLLSPDSYRSLRELVTSKERDLLAVKERNRLPGYSIWYVSFFAQEQGETRFSPQEFIINNTGRDFRPLDMLPITPGFGEYRLTQREVQSALLIFDGQIDVNQPITALMESTPSVTDWNRVMQRIERERALVRSRAAAAPKPPV